MGPEDHRCHHQLPGLMQGLPGREVSPGTPSPPSLILAWSPWLACGGGHLGSGAWAPSCWQFSPGEAHKAFPAPEFLPEV